MHEMVTKSNDSVTISSPPQKHPIKNGPEANLRAGNSTIKPDQSSMDLSVALA